MCAEIRPGPRSLVTPSFCLEGIEAWSAVSWGHGILLAHPSP